MTTLTPHQINCIKDALKTFESIAFESPFSKEETYELIGRWQTVKRLLAELCYDDEYFEDLSQTPYQLPYEWGEKIFTNKHPKEILGRVLSLCDKFSPALDSDAACFRVFRRTIAELLGKDLGPYRLLMEKGPVLAMYCKEPILD